MKTLATIFVLLALCTGVAFAADVTGKWVAESKTQTKEGEERTVTTTFDLKADGSTLTGSVTTSMGAGGRGRAIDIKDGKIDGNKITFSTVQQGKNGEVKMNWTATVDGAELKGNRVREGGQGRGMEFTAKKQ